jgi:hypothetical protein
LYIDASIRLKSNEIQPVKNVLNELGILTQFIGFDLVCYTNPRMFDWFGLDVDEYADSFTIDANIIMFKRTLETELIMKAWVTCALDGNCIAPPGSRLGRCCGCHRYDQDAITIITSFFFVHQRSGMYTPIAFTEEEKFFYSLQRKTTMHYFEDTSIGQRCVFSIITYSFEFLVLVVYFNDQIV